MASPNSETRMTINVDTAKGRTFWGKDFIHKSAWDVIRFGLY